MDWKTHKLPLFVIFVFSFVLYANTLNHEFVLDDKIVITENQFTKKGFDGIADIFKNDSMTGFFGRKKSLVAGGRYRPFSMAVHAIEWELFGKNASVYHFVNVLCYAFTGVFLYLILALLFPFSGSWMISLAFMATLLFQANPLHTEVVANIKSRDEILSILFTLISFYSILLAYLNQKKNYYALGAGFFLLGMLSKESAIVFVGIIPLCLWILYREKNLKSLTLPILSLLIPAIVYLLIRASVLGFSQPPIAKELMNNPFLNASSTEQLATCFYVLLLYLKLLLFPHPLTHDYYPKQIPIVDWSEPMAFIGLVMYLTLIVFFIWGVLKRKIHGLFAGVYLAGIVLYSNLLFPIGTFMNERFLYVPSLAFALLVAWLLTCKIPNRAPILALFGLLIAFYSFKTIDRNRAWESDTTLSLTDIKVSSNSAKCNMSAGLALIDRAGEEKNPTQKQKDLVQAINYLKRSLEIYPKYTPPVLLLGNAYTGLEDFSSAIYYYELCLKYKSQVSFALTNLEFVAQESAKLQLNSIAEDAYKTYLKYKEDPRILEKLGEHYGKNMQEFLKASETLEKANKLKPKDPNILQKLGVAHGMMGNTQQAIFYFRQALDLDPKNANLWLNLGYAYHSVGKPEEGNQFLAKAYDLNPQLKPSP